MCLLETKCNAEIGGKHALRVCHPRAWRLAFPSSGGPGSQNFNKRGVFINERVDVQAYVGAHRRDCLDPCVMWVATCFVADIEVELCPPQGHGRDNIEKLAS